MAKKIKNTFEDVMDALFQNKETIDWNGVSISVSKTIPLSDTLDFVKSVVDSCFDDAGVYTPELKDFAFRVNVVKKYTNITLPVGASKQYELLYRTDLYGVIMNVIDDGQISVICQALDEKIVYECDTQMRDLRVRLENMITSLGVIADNSMAMFGGINQDDIEKLVKAVSNSKLDESAVVEALLEQQKK